MTNSYNKVKFSPIMDKVLLVSSLLFCLGLTNLPLLGVLLLIFISQTYTGGLLLLYISCLPLTPALVALYGIEMEWLAKKSSSSQVISGFFRLYRKGFKTGVIWGMCLLLPIVILLFDFLLIASPFRYAFLFFLLVILAMYVYGVFFLAKGKITFAKVFQLASTATFKFIFSTLILSCLTVAMLAIGVISNLFLFGCTVIVLSFMQLYLLNYVVKKLPSSS